MPRQSRQRFQQSRRRPNRDWAGLVSSVGVSVAASSKVLLGSFLLANPGIDETILRTVGTMNVVSNQTAATEEISGAVGMRLVSDTAATIGVASLPDPVTDASDDGWFFYQAFVDRFLFKTGAGLESSAGQKFNFDSRAKRIIEDGSRVVIVAANGSASTAFVIQLSVRLLTQVRGTG